MASLHKQLKSIKPGEMVTKPGTPSCGPNEHNPRYPKGMDKTAPGGKANMVPSLDNEPLNKGQNPKNYD